MARAGGLELTGEGGLLAQLTKRLVESALDGEITEQSKTVLTEVGPVEIEVPRTGRARSSRRSSPNASDGSRVSTSW